MDCLEHLEMGRGRVLTLGPHATHFCIESKSPLTIWKIEVPAPKHCPHAIPRRYYMWIGKLHKGGQDRTAQKEVASGSNLDKI